MSLIDRFLQNFWFAEPLWFVLLPLIALIWAVIHFIRRRQKPAGIITPSIRMFGSQQVRPSRLRYLGLVLRCLTILMIVVALARPQGGRHQGSRSAEGVDIMLAIDTSGSMKARDFVIDGERPNRLEVIKRVIADFILERPDDRIGIVVFGTEAFTQAPLTLDHEVLLKFLDQLEIGMAGEATAIGDGLATSVLRLKNQLGESRVVVLLTDGANNAGRMDPMAASAAAKSFGIRVHTIGVGSEGEVPIISNGQVVYIRADIDEKLLTAISTETGGVYRRATDTAALKGVYHEIDQLEKRRLEVKDQRSGRDFFTYPILLALMFLGLELLWRLTKWRVIP